MTRLPLSTGTPAWSTLPPNNMAVPAEGHSTALQSSAPTPPPAAASIPLPAAGGQNLVPPPVNTLSIGADIGRSTVRLWWSL
eukprot:CAMPEP_0182588400 /NCGR_PEP_ID=MMETSP1324-20130603/67109_1 /TAXON_ID=236786 /ORGANISM="Florenciella sp., Strain RCC1587" /LENGTH=81 /DNA_ID=CAMNT_0024805459 /DNA_START=84 /DNA_END=329 /DNA_ORIENTATION=-